MRVTFTLHDKQPEAQALMRQLSAVAHGKPVQPVSRFPFNLLERVLRAGLDRLEDTIRAGVMAAIRQKRSG